MIQKKVFFTQTMEGSPEPWPQQHVLFVEDDLGFAQTVQRPLESLGFEVTHVGLGMQGLAALAKKKFDLCLLDWSLPDMTGPELMAKRQQMGPMPPVIFLTGVDAPAHISQMLLAGADDYVIKPPVLDVLTARIRAVLRRTNSRIPHTSPSKDEFGRLCVNYATREFMLDGKSIHLQEKERLIAILLFLNRDTVLSRQELNQALGLENPAVDTRQLDVYLSRLRHKLQLHREFGWRLSSVTRQGYRLEYLLDREADK